MAQETAINGVALRIVIGVATAMIIGITGWNFASVAQYGSQLATQEVEITYLKDSLRLIREEQQRRTGVIAQLEQKVALLEQRMVSLDLKLSLGLDQINRVNSKKDEYP